MMVSDPRTSYLDCDVDLVQDLDGGFLWIHIYHFLMNFFERWDEV